MASTRPVDARAAVPEDASLGRFTRFLLRRSVPAAAAGVTAVAIVASVLATAFWAAWVGEKLPAWAYGIAVAVPLCVAPLSITPHLLLLRRFVRERARVQQLTALLPMCAWCRKVRTEESDWHEIERYLAERSNAEVTHSICPECAERVGEDDRGR